MGIFTRKQETVELIRCVAVRKGFAGESWTYRADDPQLDAKITDLRQHVESAPGWSLAVGQAEIERMTR